MARNTTPKSVTTAVETIEEVEALELLDIVDAGIKQIVADHGIDIQKSRYKAMRAIAWKAFEDYITAGTFDDLVERASADVDNLPIGWMLTAEAEKAKKAAAPKATPAPKPTAKPAAKAPAKPAVKRTAQKPAEAPAAEAKPARRRPVRKAAAATTESNA